MSEAVDKTRMLAESHGLKFTDCGNGHVQIENHGARINYWPDSKRRTAYLVGTGNKSIPYCSPWDVVKMCMESGRPGLKPKKNKISNSGPNFDLKPVRTGIVKHTYTGDRPPWEYPTLIMSHTDLLRIEAHNLMSTAEMLDTPEYYEKPTE